MILILMNTEKDWNHLEAETQTFHKKDTERENISGILTFQTLQLQKGREGKSEP